MQFDTFFGRNNLVTHLNNSVGSNPKFNEILRFSEELFLELRTRFSEQKWSDGPRSLNRGLSVPIALNSAKSLFVFLLIS